MKNKKHNIPTRYSYHRPIISDILPFEVPPSFSNGGFFNFLTKYNVRLEQKGNGDFVLWDCPNSSVDEAISVIFCTEPNKTSNLTQIIRKHDGNEIKVRKWKLLKRVMWTRPLHFNISHKENDFRQLTVIHPRNQLLIADFYKNNYPQILYHTSLSSFSIRKPSKIAQTSYFKDKLHTSLKGAEDDNIEEHQKEYDNLGSYFKYSKFSNIFKFYEHYQYHNAEKKFDKLIKLDISKCFDSIYTHTLAWTVLGIDANKDNLEKSKTTFGSNFDKILREMNKGETNGIVIGPEFSRIFAEIILQGVDRKLEATLKLQENIEHKVDYEIYRYVDDYFVFYNSDKHAEDIKLHLAKLLKEIKLSLNSAKSETFTKPIITNLTIGKNKVSSLLNVHLKSTLDEEDHPTVSGEIILKLSTKIKANDLIVDFKTAVKESGISYKDILNYTFAAIEQNVEKTLNRYKKSTVDFRDPKQLTNALLAIMEFSFFIYSASPRVNISVRLTRTISLIVDELNKLQIKSDMKHQVYKYIFDNIVRQLRKKRQDKFNQVETLYLILALAKLGRAYQIDETILASYFGMDIDKDEKKTNVSIGYFSITVCLLLIRNRKKYSKLKDIIEHRIVDIFESKSAYVNNDTELLLLYLDLQCCPYISIKTKMKLATYFSQSVWELYALGAAADYWFTDWKSFNLSLELDKKRARDVY